MILYHITSLEKPIQSILIPKIPDETEIGENYTEKRICLAPSILECLKSAEIVNKFDDEVGLVRVYKVKINEDDPNLVGWNKLYEEGLVPDAALTHEYWYKKPIMPIECSVYRVSGWTKKEYIIVDAVQKEQIKKILFEMKLYDGQIEKWSAFDIVNYWLPLHGEIWVERFKQRLVHSVIDYTPESAKMYESLFGEKPKLSHEEQDFHINKYLETCTIVKESSKEKTDLFQFEKCYSEEIKIYKKEYKLILAWEFILPDFVWRNNAYLWKIKDSFGNITAFLYYFIEQSGKYNISCLEVVPFMRNQGMGEKIIKQFFDMNSINPRDIRVEPPNLATAKFWRKCGVECSCPEE